MTELEKSKIRYFTSLLRQMDVLNITKNFYSEFKNPAPDMLLREALAEVEKMAE